jgi:hypothetical protein
LKLIAENKFSGEEEDDRELLIVLDEWIRKQTSAASSNRPSKRTRQQPLPSQPLVDIAAGIKSIVAELKADREGVVTVAPAKYAATGEDPARSPFP